MQRYVELKLGTKTYRLVPGAGALIRVAKEVGDPMDLLIEFGAASMGGRSPKLLTVLKTLYVGIAESGYELTEEEAYEFMHKAGVQGMYEPYGVFLGALMNRGEVPDVEYDEPVQKKRTRSTGRKSSRTSSAGS